MTTGSGVPLSVVMVCGDRPELLALTLPAVLAAGFQPSHDEMLVVIDGHSQDEQHHRGDTARLFPAARVLVSRERRGVTALRSWGVAAAVHSTVVLMSHDVRLRPGTLDRHRLFHGRSALGPSLLVGDTQVVPTDRSGLDDIPTLLAAAEQREESLTWRNFPDVIAQTLRVGHLSARRMDLLASDSVLPAGETYQWEDIDLGLRLAVVGVRMHFDDGAKADRFHQQRVSAYLRSGIDRGRGAAVLGRRWPTVVTGPTAASGQSLVRTVTSVLFRRPAMIRVLLWWLRIAGNQASDRQCRRLLRARHLVEQAWFDHAEDERPRSAATDPAAVPHRALEGLTSGFAQGAERA